MNLNILSHCRRVVVTGIGIVSPLGCGNINIYNKILSSQSGISLLPSHININNEINISANVPIGEGIEDFNEKKVFGRIVSRELSLFMQYAIYASDLALKNANLIDNNTNQIIENINKLNFGVSIASGIGSLQDICDSNDILETSYKKLSAYFIPKILINLASGHISIRHKLLGPCNSSVTACAASAHSIGDAVNYIRLGYADRMLAGNFFY